MSIYPWCERTAQAIVDRLHASKHAVHRGAAHMIADEFLPDGRVHKARVIAEENGWPVEAVMAGLELGKPPKQGDQNDT